MEPIRLASANVDSQIGNRLFNNGHWFFTVTSEYVLKQRKGFCFAGGCE